MDEKQVTLKKGETVVSEKTLTSILEQQAKVEKEMEDLKAKNAGLEEMFSKTQEAGQQGGEKLRERKNFEPSFRTVRIRKYPIAGDIENLGYVIGWTNRGAYQKVDRDGIAPTVVDYIDIIYLGREKSKDGKIQAESVKLLSLLNAEQVHCKVLDVKDYKGRSFTATYPKTGLAEEKVPTGEEISVTTWDPKHGLVESGEKIDGYVAFTNLSYVIQIPGVAEPVEIDAKFAN